MGAYYAAYYYQCNCLHMAHYFHVRRGQLLWINGRHYSQSEPVLPSHRGAPYFNCRPLRHHRISASSADAVRSHTSVLCNEEAFHIMCPKGQQLLSDILSLSLFEYRTYDASLPQRLLGIPLLPTTSARCPGRHDLVAFQNPKFNLCQRVQPS